MVCLRIFQTAWFRFCTRHLRSRRRFSESTPPSTVRRQNLRAGCRDCRGRALVRPWVCILNLRLWLLGRLKRSFYGFQRLFCFLMYKLGRVIRPNVLSKFTVSVGSQFNLRLLFAEIITFLNYQNHLC